MMHYFFCDESVRAARAGVALERYGVREIDAYFLVKKVSWILKENWNFGCINALLGRVKNIVMVWIEQRRLVRFRGRGIIGAARRWRGARPYTVREIQHRCPEMKDNPFYGVKGVVLQQRFF